MIWFAVVTLGLLAAGSTAAATAETDLAFSASRTLTGYRAKGEVGVIRQERYAIRADGAWVLAHGGLEGGASEIWIVHHPEAGRRIVVNTANRAATTYPMERAARTAAACEGTSAGERLGVAVVRRERVEDFVNQKIRITEFVAPSLGCFALWREDLIEREGTPPARIIVEVTAVDRTEPDARLFEIPAGYIEQTPSGVLGARVEPRTRSVADSTPISVRP